MYPLVSSIIIGDVLYKIIILFYKLHGKTKKVFLKAYNFEISISVVG